jgi:hypothetical protein
MRRREFIILSGGAAMINPFSVRAQQSPSPLIGLLDAADANVRYWSNSGDWSALGRDVTVANDYPCHCVMSR